MLTELWRPPHPPGRPSPAAPGTTTRLEVRVISDAQEAWYGYLAIANSLTLTDGFGIDVGGGSIQVMRIADRRLKEAQSMRLGSVRVSEAFLEGEETTGKQIKALREHVSRTLSEFEWWKAGDGQRLAGIGGTIRNLATAAQKRLELPDVDVQGFLLTRDVLEELIELLASKPAAKRSSVAGIKPDRGDVILGGALVLAGAMDHGGFDAVEVIEAGLREGVFFERLLEDRDPPLLEDVRRESVINLAHRFRTDDEHVEHVARLSLEMFDALKEVDPDPSELGNLERKGDRQRLLLLCGVIRLAEQLERSRDGSAVTVELDDREPCVILRPVTDGSPRSDPSVAIWSAQRNSDILADAIGKPIEVVGPNR